MNYQEEMTINLLRERLNQSAEYLQTLPQRNSVDSDVDILFDSLAQQYSYMFSYIIDYLEQHQ